MLARGSPIPHEATNANATSFQIFSSGLRLKVEWQSRHLRHEQTVFTAAGGICEAWSAWSWIVLVHFISKTPFMSRQQMH
ncbi:bcl-2-like protein 13 [Platysternon megacephalum]|uniref:Bcl-2-like protein 13 n=1 Tax=Platysternon megacephalum TaxID=55544 RepID=A0A4D9E4J2_9SAUR|nr:bcl-2-like protein 13 [Platysternon megacephalum]